MAMKEWAFGILWEGEDMRNNKQRCLIILLTIVSTVSFVNVLVMYWLPCFLPLSVISILRTAIIALVERRYDLIVISFLACVLLFLSTISVRRQHVVLPILSVLYLTYDFVFVLWLLIDTITNNDFTAYYITSYSIKAFVSFILIVLLGSYCQGCLKEGRGDGSPVS